MRPMSVFASLISGVLLAAASAGADAPPPGGFDVQKLDDGVYAVVRKEPPGFAFESNSVFIIGASDVVVVDSQSNFIATRAVLAALRNLTDKPVRYVINTHWHFDHVTGNQVYREAFPGVQFIAHTSMREDLLTLGAAARKGYAADVPQFIEQLRGILKKNKNSAGQDLTDEQRESLRSDVVLGESYLTVPPETEPVPATMTFDDRLTLYQGTRRIDIRYLGKGHTRGDIIVHLPKEGIVVAGDLLDWPIPLVGTTSFPVEFGPTLESLRSLGAGVIVPGHGPVLRDKTYLDLVIRLLTSIREQTRVSVANGESLEQTRKSVKLDELQKLFTGDSKVRKALFLNYVVDPAVARAFEELSAKP